MSIKSQLSTDKAAISLSLICVAHCFFAPSFIILTSALASFTVDNEFIHKFILFVAVPVSVYALYAGYRNHKDISFIPIAIIGLISLVLAVAYGEAFLGETVEKSMTLIGSILVAYAHLKNHQTCKKLDCNCHE
mgnify:CR=1 FL=1|jgi:hypothetical protein